MLWVYKQRPDRYRLTCRRLSVASLAVVLPDQESFPSYSALVSRLQQCIKFQALADGQRLHDRIMGSPLRGDTFLGNLVVQMYGTCGNVAASWRLFAEGIHRRNVFSWNTMMGAFLASYKVEEAMIMFERMPHWDVVSWNTILSANAQHGTLDSLRAIFDQTPEKGVISWNTIVTSYVQSNQTSCAMEAFARMPKHTVVTWTTVITALANTGHLEKAFLLFDSMPERNDVSWSALAAAYAEHSLPDRAIEVVAARMPLWSINALSSLIQALLQSHRLDQAWVVFAQMNERNQFSWNIMLQGLFACDFPSAELVLDRMPCWDVVACNTSIAAYAQTGHIAKSRAIFYAMPHSTVASWNAILDAFVQINAVDLACWIFCLMPCHDAVSWTAVLAAYAQNGDITRAQRLFEQMPAGRSIFAWNSLLHTWSQAKLPHTVAAIFNRMPGQDLVSWNTLLSAFARGGSARETVQILCRMDLESVGMDEITLVGVLDSISAAAATDFDGKLLLDEFLENLDVYNLVQSSCMVTNALVTACARAGYLNEAWTVFCNARHRDISCWSSMLSAYALNGHELQSLRLFQCMVLSGLLPDETIVVILLSACSHAGLFEAGVEFFRFLTQDFSEVEANLDHYSCLIDLLARAGKIEEAADVVHGMRFEPSLLVWTSILAGCIVHGDVARAFLAAEEITRTHPESGISYVLLSNLEKSLR